MRKEQKLYKIEKFYLSKVVLRDQNDKIKD